MFANFPLPPPPRLAPYACTPRVCFEFPMYPKTSMRVFPPERGLMIRERSTGSYRVGPYFLAKSTSDIGIYTVAPILFATVIYWCVGLRPEAGAFFTYLLLFMGQASGDGAVCEWGGVGWDWGCRQGSGQGGKG